MNNDYDDLEDDEQNTTTNRDATNFRDLQHHECGVARKLMYLHA